MGQYIYSHIFALYMLRGFKGNDTLSPYPVFNLGNCPQFTSAGLYDEFSGFPDGQSSALRTQNQERMNHFLGLAWMKLSLFGLLGPGQT